MLLGGCAVGLLSSAPFCIRADTSAEGLCTGSRHPLRQGGRESRNSWLLRPVGGDRLMERYLLLPSAATGVRSSLRASAQCQAVLPVLQRGDGVLGSQEALGFSVLHVTKMQQSSPRGALCGSGQHLAPSAPSHKCLCHLVPGTLTWQTDFTQGYSIVKGWFTVAQNLGGGFTGC